MLSPHFWSILHRPVTLSNFKVRTSYDKRYFLLLLLLLPLPLPQTSHYWHFVTGNFISLILILPSTVWACVTGTDTETSELVNTGTFKLRYRYCHYPLALLVPNYGCASKFVFLLIKGKEIADIRQELTLSNADTSTHRTTHNVQG